MRKILLFACAALAVLGCGGDYDDYKDLPPLRDGGSKASYNPPSYTNTYRTVTIGTQVWMAENLNYNAEGSKCYNNADSNCVKYGRLYNWATAMALESSCNSRNCGSSVTIKHQGICPTGWHIPSDNEWSTLINYVGGSSTAGKHLKATSGWYNCGASGSGSSYPCYDTYGFAALPGGHGSSGGNFYNVGGHGYWWSASEGGANSAYDRYMGYYYEGASWNYGNKTYLQSVRCVQD